MEIQTSHQVGPLSREPARWEEERTSVRAGRPGGGGGTLPVAGNEGPEVGRTWRQEGCI